MTTARAVALVFGLGGVIACGGNSADLSRLDGADDEDADRARDGASDEDGSNSTSNDDANGGEGDGDGDPIDRDPDPPTVGIVCGGERCTAPGQELLDLVSGLASAAGFDIPTDVALQRPCCTEVDTCGVAVDQDGQTACIPPPESDARCPELSLLGVQLPSCCLEAQGLCGINMTQFGGSACEQPFGGLADLFTGGESETCGDGAEMDAGMMGGPDAGGDGGTTPDAGEIDEQNDGAVRDGEVPSEADEDAGT